MTPVFLTTISEIRSSVGDISLQLYTTDLGQEGHWRFDGIGTSLEDNTGTVLMTADLKRFVRVFDNAINVKWFGAKGDYDPLTDTGTNDLSALRNALSVMKNKSYSAPLYFPKGIYVVNDPTGNGLDLHSNLTIKGDGVGSVILQKSVGLLLSANRGSGGSPNVADNIKNIFISNIHLKCYAGISFNENRHLLNLNAVSDILLEKCFFTGFRGDGIYIGSSNMPNTERHNENITVRDCLFDGIDKENRNCISIIDGKKVLIENNSFANCTKSNMPGAIDIEPDANAFAIIEDIVVKNNRFKNVGGNVGVISILCAYPTTNLCQKFTIIQNNIEDSNTTAFTVKLNPPSAKSSSNGVLISDNIIKNCSGCFNFSDVKGIALVNNKFQNILSLNYIGYTDSVTALKSVVYDLRISNNYFDKCTYSTTPVQFVAIFNVYRLLIESNTFKDCTTGVNGKNYLLNFQSNGYQEEVVIKSNIFYRTDSNISVVQYFTVGQAETTIPGKNIIENNTFYNAAAIGSLPYASKFGSTGNRPLLTSVQIGFEYFDTSLNKTVWWSGSMWVVNDGFKFTTKTSTGNILPGPGNEFFICSITTATTLTLNSDNSTGQGVVKEFRNNGDFPLTIAVGTGVTLNFGNGNNNIPFTLNSKGDFLRIISYGANVWFAEMINKQVIASSDTTGPIGATFSQVEIQAVLNELRDLKTKMRSAGLLA